jgi:hypothetical protein
MESLTVNYWRNFGPFLILSRMDGARLGRFRGCRRHRASLRRLPLRIYVSIEQSSLPSLSIRTSEDPFPEMFKQNVSEVGPSLALRIKIMKLPQERRTIE